MILYYAMVPILNTKLGYTQNNLEKGTCTVNDITTFGEITATS